MIINNLQNA